MRTPIVAATSLISAAAGCGLDAAPHCPPLARGLGVPLGLPTMLAAALTFDDGPHPEGTPAVLEARPRGGEREVLSRPDTSWWSGADPGEAWEHRLGGDA